MSAATTGCAASSISASPLRLRRGQRALIPPPTRAPRHMSADDRPWEAAPDGGGLGGARAAVSPLPAPPNARVDGLDVRAASLAAFLVEELGPPSPTAQTSGRGMQILSAARARQARRRRVRRTTGAGVALGALAAAGL